MTFSAPWWLIGLLPWAAVTLWLLWGRRIRADVPFLQLWHGPVQSPAAKQSFRPPPLWLALALLAMLLAILAAARPEIPGFYSDARPSIIIDRGITLSARGSTAERYRELISEAGSAAVPFGGRADLIWIPDGTIRHLNDSDWQSLAITASPTAVNTAAAVRAAVADRLAHSDGPVIVLTDHALNIDDPRLVRIAPTTRPSNVGLVTFSARERPAAQVMLRIRNQSAQTAAEIRLLSDDREIARKTIDLPPQNAERDYFLEAPAFGKVLAIELLVNDDLPADNRAWLVRERSWPIVEPRAVLPVELQRFIDRYRHLRPPTEQSTRLALVTSADALARSEPGAIIIPAMSTAATRPAGNIRQAQHPITDSVNDFSALATATITPPPAEGMWTPILWRGDTIAVAVRESPARQVYVGFHSPQWAATPAFVILWTNVFNWIGQGGEQYTAHPIQPLGPGWTIVAGQSVPEPGLTPGLYRHNDTLRAVNALDVQIDQPTPTDWRAQLDRLAATRYPRKALLPLTNILLVSALAALLLAALTWRPNHSPSPPGRGPG